MTDREQPDQSIRQLTAAIAHLESQRATLGDAVVDASVAALRQQMQALEPSSPAEQQRKQVTILFADVSGFTAMSETMDAEDVTEMMNALWVRLDQAIIDHGGIIDKHIGDAVMGLWGVEAAQENDPERATRAALVMQAELATFRQDRQVALAMRIGINTGPVLLGQVGTTGEYTAIGDTVNLASRLEEAAPVGGVLISHHTYRHVRGIFEVKALEAIRFKGKTEPVQVYLVEQAKPHAFRMGTRGVEGIETRMIGRDTELQQMQDALLEVIERRRRRMITITGEAGVGKSRLLYEFENWAELLPQEMYYFKGRARQETQNIPYALFRDLFVFRFQIQESDSQATVRAKLEEGLGEMLGGNEAGQMRAHFIGQLLGFDFSDSRYLANVLDPSKGTDPQQLRDRAILYLTGYFQTTATQDPVLILLEDYHWADDSSLRLIEHLTQVLDDQPLLVVGLARPTFFERRPDWGKDQPFHLRLDLRRLSPGESRQLVGEILRHLEALPSILEEVVIGKSGGNPFYVEELIKMLIEDGVIVKDTPYWRVEPTRLAKVRVPPTLTGILQARLDSLPPDERELLQRASVVGRVFWDAVVDYLGQATENGPAPSDAPQQGALLDALCGRELIFPRLTSAFARAREYIFKHAILRDVTYESVLKRERRAYHARVGRWLIEQAGQRADEYTGLIADHLELAGQREQAATYLRRAGEQAAARFANAEAVRYLSRALDLLEEAGDSERSVQRTTDRYTLLLAREGVYDVLGEREIQDQDLLALEELAERLADNRLRAEVALRRANYAEMTGDYPKAVAAVMAAIDWAKTAAAAAPASDQGTRRQANCLQAEAYLYWGRVLSRQGDYESARTQLERALALARAVGFPQVEANTLRNLGAVCWYQDDYAGATVFYEQALDIYRRIQDLRGEGHTLNNLGVIPWSQSDLDGAKSHFEQSLRIHREIGDHLGEGITLNNLGLVSLGQGDFVGAMTYYQQGLQIYSQVGDRDGEVKAFNNLGVVSRGLGHYTAARDYLEHALRISCEIGDRRGESMALSNLGLVYHNQGDHKTARECSEKALLIAEDIGIRDAQGEALTNLGHALVGLGSFDEAAQAYHQALIVRRELGRHNEAMESLAGLARVSLAQGDLNKARTQVEEILGHIDESILGDTEEPFHIYLTCYQVMQAAQDPRAGEILTFAHNLLKEQAAKISDEELRHSFLENVAVHQEIVRTYSNVQRRPMGTSER